MDAVTDRARLEARYRRLLGCYPKSFRNESGQEMLAVLMAMSEEDARLPGLATSVDLIRTGLSMRLRGRGPEAAPTIRVAVSLMYGGAVLTTLILAGALIALPFVGRQGAMLRLAGHTQPLPLTITIGVLGALGVAALWVGMALGISHGRRWARVASTVLFGLATAALVGVPSEAHPAVDLVFWVPTWLVGAAAVFLLWRPGSDGFLSPQELSEVGRRP